MDEKKTDKMEYQAHTLVDQDSKKLVFKLTSFDHLEQFAEVQRLNLYTLLWIQAGEGEAIVDFNTYRYQAGRLFSFTPYQPFLIKPEGPARAWLLQFHSDFFCIHKHHQEVACHGVLFNTIYNQPFVEVDELTANSFQMIIGEIEKGIEQNEMAMHELVLSYLKLFLIHASRLRQKQEPAEDGKQAPEASIPQQLKKLIEQNFKKSHSPKDYADLLYISPKALGKIAKKYFNKNLTTVIAERIIIEAKRELYLTSKSVREIAYELGYDDEYYFSRFFKKNTSITPSVFRKTVGFAKGEM